MTYYCRFIHGCCANGGGGIGDNDDDDEKIEIVIYVSRADDYARRN